MSTTTERSPEQGRLKQHPTNEAKLGIGSAEASAQPPRSGSCLARNTIATACATEDGLRLGLVDLVGHGAGSVAALRVAHRVEASLEMPQDGQSIVVVLPVPLAPISSACQPPRSPRGSNMTRRGCGKSCQSELTSALGVVGP